MGLFLSWTLPRSQHWPAGPSSSPQQAQSFLRDCSPPRRAADHSATTPPPIPNWGQSEKLPGAWRGGSPMEHHSVWQGDRTLGRESPWNLKGGSPSLSSHPGQPWWSNFLAAASSHLTGRSFAPRAAAPRWSQCQKALRPCKASFKMLFIRVNSIKKERTV